MKKCTKVFCVTCPYVVPGNKVKCCITKKEVKVNVPVTCQTSNLVYCISCKVCNQKYVGQTKKTIAERFSQHRGYVNSYQSKIATGKRIEATGAHFNLPGHSLSDMKLQVIEKVFDKSEAVRLTRERLYINLFEAENLGMNKKS